MEEAGYRDVEFTTSICNFLESISDDKGLVPFFLDSAYESPMASHWINSSIPPGLNPTASICGFLHYQGVQDEWLSLATETCYQIVIENPPLEAHALCGVAALAEYIPDRNKAMNLVDAIALALPRARFFIPEAPVNTYGMTPLHFAPRPNSSCRPLFTQSQIDGHLEELVKQQLPDGGWPILWEAPGPASESEWRGRITFEAICRLHAYGVI